mmetsp:Transcript_42936/g.134111  ORF Transcript_42936/g.134111 Transcript_42936/m.134111 type:complete len:205 (-) Transcript_42936:1882-2496(-)
MRCRRSWKSRAPRSSLPSQSCVKRWTGQRMRFLPSVPLVTHDAKPRARPPRASSIHCRTSSSDQLRGCGSLTLGLATSSRTSNAICVPWSCCRARRVPMECSVSVAEGLTVPMATMRASALEKESESTRVRRLSRYGGCWPLDVRMTRKHSLSAKIVELISAASLRLCESWCELSSRRSLPAQSTSVSTGRGGPLPPGGPPEER